jgi:hypothetical protein
MSWRRAAAGYTLVLAVCTGCAMRAQQGSAATFLPLKARVEAIDEVIIMRYGRISNWGQVDACSVYRVLDRDPAFRERLNPTARTKLSRESAAECETADPAATVHGRWYVRTITATAPAEIAVLIGVIGESGTHRETYVLDQRYRRGWWVLREVRSADFSID